MGRHLCSSVSICGSLVALLLSAGVARAQTNLALLISQPGDWIGQGGTYVTTNETQIGISGLALTVTVSAFGFNMIFDAPGQNYLGVGTYSNAVRYPFNGGSPGLDVSGNGRGCNGVCGTFEILEIGTDGSGNVNHFWATFTETCECSDPPLRGEVRYHSQLAPPEALPRTLHVPADYPTITAAISNASLLAVDTVLVAPGAYSEGVSFSGKSLRLMSEGGSAQTFLTGGVSFSGGESPDTLLAGFTITNGGGPVFVGGGSPTIVSNLITSSGGHGIYCEGGSPVIRNNEIVGCAGAAVVLSFTGTPLVEGNLMATNGVGMYVFSAGTAVLRNNIIRRNGAAGIDMTITSFNAMDVAIIQNLIVENTGNGIVWELTAGLGALVVNNTIARNGAAGISADGYDATSQILNNIVVGSPALSVGSSGDGLPPIIQYNDFYSPSGPACTGLVTNLAGIGGNLSANPLFTCAPANDYRLLAGSPCTDAGTNGAPQLPATDLNGGTRILDGDTNGVAVVDMGALEFDPAAPPVPCFYLSCPTNIVAIAPPGQTSVVVNYPPPDATPVAAVTNVPPTGSAFPGGTNSVTCTATYGTNVTTCSFSVTVLLWLTITVQPQNTNVLTGRDFSLSVQATGSSPLAYAWTFEDNAIAGATNSTLVITNTQPANEGIYKAIVSNGAGSVTSRVAVVRVLPAAPLIVAGPNSLAVAAGSNALFSVAANGSTPMSYQWFMSGTPLAGAAATQLTLTNVQAANAGSYQVVVTNLVGAVTSAVATLTVLDAPPWFLQQPAGGTIKAGSNFTLTAVARGSQPLAYQWQQNGAGVPGATLSSLTLSNATLASAGSYDLVVSNAVGVATSSVVQVKVIQKPLLLVGLTNQIVDAGSNVLLAVSAICSDPLSYTWGFNSLSIAGTNASLVLSNIQPSQSGYYRVTASSKSQGLSVSSTGRVSVFGPASFVVAWGDNSGGQATPPATLGDAVAVAGGDYDSLALRRNEMLAAWGDNSDGQTNVPAGHFVGIAAGVAHNLAITVDGNVVAWGRNDSGQTTVPTNASAVVSVAAGDSHSLALLSSGVVLAWGNNAFGQGRGTSELQGGSYRAIAAGRDHNLGLRTDGTLFAWGLNTFRQATPPSSLTGRAAGVAAIAAGYLHSVALLSNGTVVVWGDNSFGQTNVPSGLSNVVAIAAGDYHTLALRADGTIIGWGDNSAGQISAPALPSPAAIASGTYHGLALVPRTRLQYRLQSASLVLQWLGAGTLQSAPTPLGPFADIVGSGQSYTNTDITASARFFRVRR